MENSGNRPDFNFSNEKAFFAFVAAGLLLAIVSLQTRTPANAQSQPAQSSSTQPQANTAAGAPVDLGPDHPSYKAGLWNEGKAVDTDIKALDFLWGERYRRGYRPEQPIRYSHQLHIEKNQMECTYCHSGVTKSNFATLPSAELCMGCHKSVKPESPEIQKLKGYYDRGEPVPWVSVNNLPEHVRFTHKRHVKAGVSCQSCHGQIQKMEVVERASSLKMGFCVSCHRDNGASIDCSVCHY